MRIARPLLAALLCCALPGAAVAGPGAHPPAPKASAATPPPPAAPVPVPDKCEPLPRPRSGPPPFPAGESLAYDVDVMGVRAGTMQFDVLRTSRRNATEIPVRVRAESNTFFDKVRKVKAELYSHLRPRDLRPRRFREDLVEGERSRVAEVSFSSGDRRAVTIEWRGNTGAGKSRSEIAHDALDYVGGIFLFRALPLTVGQSFCFDVYAMRRMWRVTGKVEAKEHVSTPAGEFPALHLSGVATRLGPGRRMQREVHVWLSDDEMRLPLAAVGVIDLGPVRATLARVERADFRSEPARPSSLQW